MDRKLLLDALSTVKPAVAASSLIASLTHVRFGGDEVCGYNDQIGISAPCRAGFEGAVPGATLMSLLNASRAKEADLAAADGALAIKAGGARLKLPLMPAEAFLFDMPRKAAGDALPAHAPAFIKAIKGCLRSVSPDTSVPDQLGVTLIPSKAGARLYSINGVSMSRASVKLEGGLRRRVVLSAPFCEQLVRLADAKAKLTVADDHALLVNGDGARLFGKLVDVPKPLDFDQQFEDIVPRDLDKQSIEIPAALKLAIDRALIISDPNGERAYSRIAVKGGIMELHTKATSRGEVRDRLKAGGHPDVSVSADAQWLKVGVAEFERVLVTDGAVVFSRPGELYLVATSD